MNSWTSYYETVFHGVVSPYIEALIGTHDGHPLFLCHFINANIEGLVIFILWCGVSFFFAWWSNLNPWSNTWWATIMKDPAGMIVNFIRYCWYSIDEPPQWLTVENKWTYKTQYSCKHKCSAYFAETGIHVFSFFKNMVWSVHVQWMIIITGIFKKKCAHGYLWGNFIWKYLQQITLYPVFAKYIRREYM